VIAIPFASVNSTSEINILKQTRFSIERAREMCPGIESDRGGKKEVEAGSNV